MWYDTMFLVFFIIVHVFNMQYINNEKCREEADCESAASILAIYDGRLNISIKIIGVLELVICISMLIRELRELVSDGWIKYKEQIFWNFNDLVMPISFMVGWALDGETVATTWCRISYTLTTMSLLFALLKKLRLTDRFSFIIVCIFKSLYQIGDYVLFLFVLILFITVSYSNLGYVSPYTDKFNVYFANFIQCFKMAMGESQTDEILELEGGLYYACWFLFIFLAFFTTIVYMNILIAVVSDQFEHIYEHREFELYRLRLPYILKV
jgi:hypothetical protein